MNTDDRELLELAAKAAGLPVEFDCEVNDWFALGRLDDGDVDKWWNPLEDDGDALRLAHALRMIIEPLNTLRGEHYGFAAQPSGRDDCGCVELGSEIAALRRAIVRAAAEIGRNMK